MELSLSLPRLVRKRDGQTVDFDINKISAAIEAAWREVKGEGDELSAYHIARTAQASLLNDRDNMIQADVERVQDAVELALMRAGRFDVAKAYILYRQKRTEIREAPVAPDPEAISQYIHASKYARWREDLSRRELFHETVERVRDMHLRRFDHLGPAFAFEIREAFRLVAEKRVLPSMRALDNATPIPTPDGWKLVGDVEVGDTIFDSDGNPTKVVGLAKFKDIELFDVCFSDGTSLRACADHRWVTSTLDDRVAGNKTRVVTTRQIAETLTQKSGNEKYPVKYNHAVWNPGPLQLPAAELSLDPYILGLWLGDGFALGGQFACHQNDSEIAEAYEAAGFPVKRPSDGNPYAWSTKGLATVLRAMGLRGNKHVPATYLRASYDQRLALVQGLMDSDGHTTPEGRSIFTNTDPALYSAFCELVASLGIKYVSTYKPRKEPHHKDSWSAAFFSSLPVHRLSRKLANIRDDHRSSNTYRTIQAVNPSGRGDATCFTVDAPSHTYLAGKNMVVTHNTMQFAGPAIEANHLRGFNCSATLMDRAKAFSEVFYLLLCGCGVGYSVQKQHVAELPMIGNMGVRLVHHVQDTIEGWADALDALITNSLYGFRTHFDYSLVRPKGTPLKTSGGRAPGHEPLEAALNAIALVLEDAQGRQLSTFEVHRILCHAADAVLSGGIRRSAMIALFSVDDEVMLSCKSTPTWFTEMPWLARANNSVMLHREHTTREQYERVFAMTREYGEPGFMFVGSYTTAWNPCGEANLQPITTNGTGFGFCNLTTMNAAMFHTLDDFIRAARAATLIGTLQASYTEFKYLSIASRVCAKRDALLGVSMTGMQDAPAIALDPENQKLVAGLVKQWNAEFAEIIGIAPAARTALVKPEGTSSLVLACKETPAVGSGIHPHHARRYIRRVTANALEIPFMAFRAANPHMCVQKPNGDWVIEFPIEIAPEARTRDDLTALDFLQTVHSTQRNWVAPGTARGIETHNVSNTVSVRENEWDGVADYLWENRGELTGVSFMSYVPDGAYAFAPFEAVSTPELQARWTELARDYTPVDYASVREDEDATSLKSEAACAGGQCEWNPS